MSELCPESGCRCYNIIEWSLCWRLRYPLRFNEQLTKYTLSSESLPGKRHNLIDPVDKTHMMPSCTLGDEQNPSRNRVHFCPNIQSTHAAAPFPPSAVAVAGVSPHWDIPRNPPETPGQTRTPLLNLRCPALQTTSQWRGSAAHDKHTRTRGPTGTDPDLGRSRVTP